LRSNPFIPSMIYPLVCIVIYGLCAVLFSSFITINGTSAILLQGDAKFFPFFIRSYKAGAKVQKKSHTAK